MAEPQICSLCTREPPYLTRHHLVPAVKGGKETIKICSPCHSQIHKMFTNSELKYNFNTLETLLANEKVQTWIKFAKKQKDFNTCMKTKKKS